MKTTLFKRTCVLWINFLFENVSGSMLSLAGLANTKSPGSPVGWHGNSSVRPGVGTFDTSIDGYNDNDENYYPTAFITNTTTRGRPRYCRRPNLRNWRNKKGAKEVLAAALMPRLEKIHRKLFQNHWFVFSMQQLENLNPTYYPSGHLNLLKFIPSSKNNTLLWIPRGFQRSLWYSPQMTCILLDIFSRSPSLSLFLKCIKYNWND